MGKGVRNGNWNRSLHASMDARFSNIEKYNEEHALTLRAYLLGILHLYHNCQYNKKIYFLYQSLLFAPSSYIVFKSYRRKANIKRLDFVIEHESQLEFISIDFFLFNRRANASYSFLRHRFNSNFKQSVNHMQIT